MIVIDILLIILAVALVTVGTPIVVRRIALMSPKRKVLEQASAIDERGEVNALKLERDERRRCTICAVMTSGDKDLLIFEGWVHSSCYLARELAALNKDKNHA